MSAAMGIPSAGSVQPTSIRLDVYDRAFLQLVRPAVVDKLMAMRVSDSDLMRYLIRVGAMAMGVSQKEVLDLVKNGEVE